MYGENYGTGTLTEMLARIATALARDETYLGYTQLEDAKYLMEGSIVLWGRLVEEEIEEARNG